MADRKKISVTDQISIALIELMTEKSFTEITVSDVIKRAGVARASFYRNYSSTSDVLDYILDDLTDRIPSMIPSVFRSDDERSWRDFLFHFIYNMDTPSYRLITNNPSNLSMLFHRMNDRIRKSESDQLLDSISERYRIAARMGLITNTLTSWFDHGKKETPEEMVDYLTPIIRSL